MNHPPYFGIRSDIGFQRDENQDYGHYFTGENFVCLVVVMVWVVTRMEPLPAPKL